MPASPIFKLAIAPVESDLYRCVHCGLCLPVCPTYEETKLETASPRGRLALMKAVNEGRVGLTPRVQEHLELCVQCRACEAACPSGVPFGRIMEATRAQNEERKQPSLRAHLARTLAFRIILPHPALIRVAATGLKLYQRLGIQWLLRRTRILALVPALRRMDEQLPSMGKTWGTPGRKPLRPIEEATRHVALLSGCVMPYAFGRVHEATARVLLRNGCSVAIPNGQVCCGALHAHSGHLEGARGLARKNIDAFGMAEVEAIVVNSAGCGAAMKEYGDLLKNDSRYAKRAAAFSEKVRDVNQYLAALPIDPPNEAIDQCVTYQDSCHLAHAQRIKDAPRALLRSIRGLRLVEMEHADACCGAGGAYALTQPEMSARLLESKMRYAAEIAPDIIATANPGCMIQLQAGVRQAGLSTRVVHVVELLDEAYRKEANRSLRT